MVSQSWSNLVSVIRIGGRHSVYFTLISGLLLGSGAALAVAPVAQAATDCPEPSADLGSVSVSINVSAADNYVIWTRMAVPDSTNSYVNLKIDDKICYVVGGPDATTAHDWKWVDQGNRSESDRGQVKEQLSAGAHTLTYTGTNSGVILDRVIVTPDGCIPEDKGDNCPAGDSKGPSVNVVTPAANSSDSGAVDIAATASDPNGIKEVQFLIDGVLRGIDNKAPYNFNWDSSSAINGNHNVQVKALDKSGNIGLSSLIPFKIFGGGRFKHGDINQDGVVNVKDLSSVLRNWGKPTPDPAGADTNNDKKVDIKDLLSVVSDWSK